MLKRCLLFILLSVCVNTTYAQCTIKNNNQGGILECDVSFTLLKTQAGGATMSNAWVPDSDKRDEINNSLDAFSKIWCLVTSGYSRIAKISIFTDGRNADVHVLNETDRSNADLGGLFYTKPSIRLFQPGGEAIIAHEFAHAAFKVYDEYREDQGSSRCAVKAFHDTLPLLMGNFTDSLRFSYAGDYPERQSVRTAQYDCYGKSVWDVITQSAYRDDPRATRDETRYPRQDYFFQMGVGVPDSEQLEQVPNLSDFGSLGFNSTYTCDATAINWVSSANTVVMMMDHSASMGDNQRLALAKQAAKDTLEVLYAEAPPIELGIISFDDTAKTEVVPSRLDATENLRMIQSAIDSLVAGGGTDYAAALGEAQRLFEDAASDGHQTFVIISDGETEQPDYRYFRDNDISVYTVELDTEGRVTLQDATLKTRNRFKIEVDAQRLPDFLPSIFRNESLIRNAQLVKSISLHNRIFEDVVTTNTVISEMTESASFILRWDGDAYFESFTLQAPDGVIIDQAYADSLAIDGVTDEVTGKVRYLQSDTQAIYYVGSPTAGLWQVRITGTGNFAYEAAVHSGINVDINAGAEIIVQEVPNEVVSYPEPIPILVNVDNGVPITRADVKADITMPDESMISVILTDDGNAPDEVADDGLYSAMLADYSQDGICEIKVTVSNLEGDALLDDTNGSYHPMLTPPPLPLSLTFPIFNVPTVPQQAPIFQQIVYDQVDVANTEEKMIPPPLSFQPTTITSIPYVAKGSIERVGQVNWYVFDAMSEGETYYLQTSHLMGYDDTRMATELSLYEPDGTSLIERSVRHRGSDVSSIEWIAPRAGDYLVSVAHAEGNRGYYEFTVSDENLLSEHEMREAEQRSSSGGFVGHPLLLLLLLAIVVLYRMRRTISYRLTP